MKIVIKSDTYNICNRIKQFDTSYKIVYDLISRSYEVYSTKLTQSVEIVSGVPLSYVCGISFKTLDERVIKYLYDTSIENIDKIIEKLDKDNLKLEQTNQLKLQQQSLAIAEDRLRQLT